MKITLVGIDKSLVVSLFLSILLLTDCGAPEDYAIPPINQDSILKATRKDIVIDQTSENKGPQKYSIEIKNMAFNPGEINVHTGDTVVWDNQDMVAHCVSEDPGKGWTSLEIKPGNTWKMVITKSTNYYCAIHQVMKGKIIVQ